jgi:hypothetical protein
VSEYIGVGLILLTWGFVFALALRMAKLEAALKAVSDAEPVIYALTIDPLADFKPEAQILADKKKLN